METVSIKLDDAFANDVQKAVQKYHYTTKTEFIREAIRNRIKELQKEEALRRVDFFYGKSPLKTTDKQLRESREKAFDELEKAMKIRAKDKSAKFYFDDI